MQITTPPEDLTQAGKALRGGHEDTYVAIVENVFNLRRLEQRIDGYEHAPRLRGAEHRNHSFELFRQEDRDTVVPLASEREQGGRPPVQGRAQIPELQGCAFVDERRRRGALLRLAPRYVVQEFSHSMRAEKDCKDI
jgi:hypothetical protein